MSQAFAEEERPRVWMGEPLVNRDRAAIEWWATLTENGVETTLAGTSVLHFDAEGLVVDQRDTWNQADGRRDPPDRWGGSGRPRPRDCDTLAVGVGSQARA